MSRPPNSRASLGRAPSTEPDNRRASVHSLNLSYAYGAPATSNARRQSSQGPDQDSRAGMSANGSAQQSVPSLGESGRAAEPAAVRYARLAQRKKDTGGNAYPPPPPVPSYSAYQNTSVNIANAFKAATSGLGGIVTGGRQEDLAADAGDDDEEADQEENAVTEEEAGQGGAEHQDLGEEDDEVNEDLGQTDGKAPSSAARKRKVSLSDVVGFCVFPHEAEPRSSACRNMAVEVRPKETKRNCPRAVTTRGARERSIKASEQRCTRMPTITSVSCGGSRLGLARRSK